jgi:hypothetical protein
MGAVAAWGLGLLGPVPDGPTTVAAILSTADAEVDADDPLPANLRPPMPPTEYWSPRMEPPDAHLPGPFENRPAPEDDISHGEDTWYVPADEPQRGRAWGTEPAYPIRPYPGDDRAPSGVTAPVPTGPGAATEEGLPAPADEPARPQQAGPAAELPVPGTAAQEPPPDTPPGVGPRTVPPPAGATIERERDWGILRWIPDSQPEPPPPPLEAQPPSGGPVPYYGHVRGDRTIPDQP